jgi:hypothetical protein
LQRRTVVFLPKRGNAGECSRQSRVILSEAKDLMPVQAAMKSLHVCALKEKHLNRR